MKEGTVMNQQVVIENCCFHLKEAERPNRGYDLYRQDLSDPAGNQEEVLLCRGLEGEMLARNKSLFVKFMNPVCAWLEIIPEQGGEVQKILQNTILLDFPENGPGMLYLDLLRKKVCLRNVKRQTLEITDYDNSMGYVLIKTEQDWFVLAKPGVYSLKMPVRFMLDGKVMEPSDNEKAECFWQYIAHTSTLVFDDHWDIEAGTDQYFEDRFRHAVLTLRSMEDIFVDIAKRGLWRKKKAFPFQGILKILKKAGAGPDEDLSYVMYTLHDYAEHGIIQYLDGFTRIFYFILYRLAKRENFMELLRNDPEELFREHLLPEKDPVPDAEEMAWIIRMMNMDTDLDRPCRIGGYDFVDGTLVTDNVEIEYGTVEGEFVIHTTDDLGYRGDVAYDLVLGEPNIQWLGEELSEESWAEVKKAFRIYGVYWYGPVKSEGEKDSLKDEGDMNEGACDSGYSS